MKRSVNIIFPKTMIVRLMSLLIFVVVIGCQSEPKVDGTETVKESNWDYIGETGPEHWSKLEIDSDCDGIRQSPINLIEMDVIEGDHLEQISIVEYENETTIESITNNGHTIQYNFNAEKNIIEYQGKNYKMKQFHFHSPSEHTINGIRYPLEIHLVHHHEETNSYVVFALMVQQGLPDSTFNFLEKHLPVESGKTKVIKDTYDLGSTVPEIFGLDSLEVFTYTGSLTTPPCTEEVLWIVVKNASSASASQIDMLIELMPKNNYRDIQDTNGRKITMEILKDL